MKNLIIILSTVMTFNSCSGQINTNTNNTMERNNNETYNIFKDYTPAKQFDIEKFNAKSRRRTYNFVDSGGINVHQRVSVIVPGRKIYGFWEVKPHKYWEKRTSPNSVYTFLSEYDVNGFLKETYTAFYGNEFGTLRNYDSSGNVVSEKDLDASYPFSIDDLIDKMKAEHDIDIFNQQLIWGIERRRGYYEVIVRDFTKTKKRMVKVYLIEGNTGKTVFVSETDASKVASLKTFNIQHEYEMSLNQLIKVPVSVGLGTLDISFNLPVPLYRTENDTIPIDTLTFERNASGEWLYKTNRLTLNPYRMSGGDSNERANEHIHMGLVRFPPVLSFRVVEADEHYWRVVVDESNFETLVIRKNPDYAVVAQRRGLFGDIDMPKDKPYKGYFAYETWEHLLQRAEFINFQGNYAVYDAPEGKKIFEGTGWESLPYSVTEVFGDWMKVTKGLGREGYFEGIKNAEGWVKWKNDTEILVRIVEYTVE